MPNSPETGICTPDVPVIASTDGQSNVTSWLRATVFGLTAALGGCATSPTNNGPQGPVVTVFDGNVEQGGEWVLHPDALPPAFNFDPNEKWDSREIFTHFNAQSNSRFYARLSKYILDNCAEFSGVMHTDETGKVPVFSYKGRCPEIEATKGRHPDFITFLYYNPNLHTVFVLEENTRKYHDFINIFVPGDKAPLEYEELLRILLAHEMAHAFFEKKYGHLRTHMSNDDFNSVHELYAYGIQLLASGKYKREILRGFFCPECLDTENTKTLMHKVVGDRLSEKAKLFDSEIDADYFIGYVITDGEVIDVPEYMIAYAINEMEKISDRVE